MKLYAIEGNLQKLDGGAMFGNAPKALWERWYPADEKNRITLATRSLLIKNIEGKNILCEVGIGDCFDSKLKERYGIIGEDVLISNIEKHGVKEEEIDFVILSHLHFDHAGGLLTKQKTLRFPKALYLVSEAHWERALHPHLRDRASFIPELHELLKASRRLVLIREEKESFLPQDISFRYTQGHTIGLCHVIIKTTKGPLFFASDLIPGMAWVHLPIVMGYDRYPESLINEKKDILDFLIQEKGFLFFTHDHKESLAEPFLNEKGNYDCRPLSLNTF